ncbi:exosortase A [Candidatus Colwellia aromaticivorans]|uniref:exosortase A n=1 Tax=Candidatus Colwellia aromaticivorans TaxID=2267621 RepID=UPI000DF1B638|nr:exosortase A [Candidatus Colwellia aromaticivorans]
MNDVTNTKMTNINRNIAICFTIFIVWGLSFYNTIFSAVEIWQKSDTFAHGFFILPIVIWLFSKERVFLCSSMVKPSSLALFPFLAAVVLWLIGQAADISVVSQFASFALLPISFWLIFGNTFAWKLKFPLFFVMFSVPMGNELIPILQEVTAEITVFFIKLSGIPVYYEGLYITIPTGVFEVAVACSGIRYLIASVTIGCLYAHLTYSTLKKQIIFIIFAALVPILANGIRAYLIVLIAHLSELKYATGFDHLIYGWLFFGLVIGLMFYIGGFWAENNEKQNNAVQENDGSFTFKFWLILPISSLITALILNFNIVETAPPSSPKTVNVFLDFEAVENNPSWGVNFDNPIAEFFGKNADNIEIYTAAFAHRQTQGELISSSNKTYNNSRWSIVNRDSVDINYQGNNIVVTHEQIVTARGSMRDTYYWYQIDGKVINNRLEVKAKQAILSLLGSSSIDYVNIVSYEHDGKASENAMIEQWLKDNFAAIVLASNNDELLK